MGYKNMEGQMDFLGLLNEYTDGQGATVRVREPSVRRSRPVLMHQAEQLSLDFDEEIVSKDIETVDAKKDEKEICLIKVSEQKSAGIIKPVPVEVNIQKDTILETAELNRVTDLKSEIAVADPEQKVLEPKHEEMVQVEVEQKEVPSEETVIEKAEEPVKEKTVRRKKAKPAAPVCEVEPEITDTNKEKLFKQCARCWCFDCKHNSRNEAVPRDMCGTRMPCPACDGCISEDCATICEIGNAKEGCMTRAKEEGIVVQEDFVY